MRRPTYVAFAVMLAISTSAFAQDTPGVSPDVTKEADQYATIVRAFLDNRFADYPSARFKEVRATYSPRLPGKPNRLSFCGQVNQRNRFGGYDGWVAFVYLPEEKGDLIVAGQSLAGGYVASGPIVSRTCADATAHWLPTDYTDQFAPKGNR